MIQPSSRFAHWIYRRLLLLAPRDVRRAYGADMAATFSALYDVAAARGWPAVVWLLTHEALELWKARARFPTGERNMPAMPARTDHRFRQHLEGLGQDVRYTARTLRRDAAWTMCAVVIVGLGVGASATVFSVVNALLLRPLPFHEPDRLVWIANGKSENLSAQTVQVGNLLDLRQQSESLADVAGFSPFYGAGDIRLTGNGEAERLTGVPVTEGFFTLLGVRPRLGRSFTAEDCRFNAPKTVVLGHALWQRRFAADPGVIGRAIVLDGAPATVVGVLPATFDFAATFTPGNRADLFTPFPLSPETDRRGNTLALIGRVKPGVDLKTAQTEATLIGERIDRSRGGTVRRNGFRPNLSPLRQRVTGRFEYALLVLAAAVGFLMLIVCANLSNLLLARASVRRQEMAVRAALGAARYQLIRQMLVESLALSGCGAVLGLALATGGTRVVSHLERTTIPLLQDVRVDGAALGFTMVMAVLTGLAVGLLPAFQVSRLAPHSALKDSGRGSIGGRGSWARRSIVVTQIAVVCVLLTGAGLLVRSLIRVLDVEPGFDAANLITVRVDPSNRDATLAQKNAYFDQLLREVRAVPGVDALGLTDALPLGDNFGWRTWTASPNAQKNDAQRQSPLVRMIDAGYLAAMKIPLRAGRSFSPADEASSEPVIIVNDALARALWPGQDPLGRLVHIYPEARRVVGVVGGVSYFGLERDAGIEMYLPLRQTGDYAVVDLVVRSQRPAASLMPAVRAALARVDPQLPATEFRTMEQLVDRSVFARRFVVLLILGFAGFGLMLTSLGIYAVIAFSVSQRTQEIGIRLALGASPRELQRRILMQTLKLALVGLAFGLPAAWMAARALQGLLFRVDASDPLTFAVVLAVLAAVAALAGYLPARQASRIDPMAALRT